MATAMIDAALREYCRDLSDGVYMGVPIDHNRLTYSTMSDDEYSYRLRKQIRELESRGDRVPDGMYIELRKVVARLAGMQPGEVVAVKSYAHQAYVDACTGGSMGISNQTNPQPVKKQDDKLEKVISYFYKRR